MAVHDIFDTNRVILYGELFGGIYPGETSQNTNLLHQTIYYSPNMQFMIFDIAYVTGPGQATYMAYNKVCELAE